MLRLWVLCAVNESYTDPKTKQTVRAYSLDWGAFAAAYPDHPAFEHGTKTEVMEWLAFIRSEESQPAGNVLLGQS